MMLRVVPSLALLLLLTPPAPAQDVPLLTIETVADGVFAFRPTNDALDQWRAVSNSGAVVLDDGILVYDSHWTPAHVEEARALLRRHTDLPIRYVVQSHFHGDHTGGAWAYADGVEIVSHHATRERLLSYYADLPGELPEQIAEQEEQLAGTTDPILRMRLENLLRYGRELLARLAGERPVPLPTLTFANKIVLHRGRTVEVYFLGRGHTDGDAVVFLPEEKIAFLGDLLWTRMLPNVKDGYTGDWIATLEQVLAFGARRFIPGHGALATAGEVRDQIAFLRWLRAAVEPFVRDGQTVEEAKARIALPEAYADYRFPWHLPAGIEKVFGELTAEGLREQIVEHHFQFIPSGDGPFPTLIAIPGCSGIAFPDPAAEAGHPDLREDDRLFRRHYLRMGERLRAEGFAVLLIHVHGAEGLVKACAGEISGERIAEYIDEAVAWAKNLDFVDDIRIHVIGWSMGGGGALAWLHGDRSQAGTVRSVVAVYPACAGREPLTNRIPLLMLLGGADDITDPAVCEGLVAASRTEPMITVRRYPGARHGFDIADAPPVLDIGNGMTIGHQRTAAEAAWREILAFLSDSQPEAAAAVVEVDHD